MREVQATEAKTRLAELLRAVENGEAIAITRHGKTVAHLVPAGVEGPSQPKNGGGTIPAAQGRVDARSLLYRRDTRRTP